MPLKTWFLLLHLLSNVELDFILFSWFRNTNQSPEILNLKVEMLFEFQNARVCVLGVLACSRALRVYVIARSRALRSSVLNLLGVLACLVCLRA